MQGEETLGAFFFRFFHMWILISPGIAQYFKGLIHFENLISFTTILTLQRDLLHYLNIIIILYKKIIMRISSK